MKQLTETRAWQALQMQVQQQNFYRQTSRAPRLPLKLSAGNISIDFTHQAISPKTWGLLQALAQENALTAKIEALMRGDKVNYNEHKPALHTALRHFKQDPLIHDPSLLVDIQATLARMSQIAHSIRNNQWLGLSGKPITDIVNIGIGGSDLGPRLCIHALATLCSPDLSYHFISDADPQSFNLTVSKLKPETTLFIIASKSFNTQETLYNSQKAKAWIGQEANYFQHFIAVTANIEKAQALGMKYILPIWDCIGGRYSLCSAINLITAIAIGFEAFSELLAGARSMDLHFRETPFSENLPVLLALAGIWNNNFLQIHNLLILTFSQQLNYFVPYIQQLDMESNGKSMDFQGKALNYATGPIIWGGSGNQAQHSYYQLLCQGTHAVTADIITLDSFDGELINRMSDAQIQILTEGVHHTQNQQDFIPGNIPLNHLRLSSCSPFNLGALVALYEHKVYTQSVIWNINPFDQPGVESAKRAFLAKQEELA